MTIANDHSLRRATSGSTLRGAAGGQVAREESHPGQQGGHEGERPGVGGAELEQQAGERAPESQGSHEPRTYSGGDEDEGVAEDHPEHRRRVGPEGHSDTDLAAALRDRVGHHAEDAEGGQEQRDRGEGTQRSVA